MDLRSGILNTTLGDLVRTNEQVRNLILQTMQITPQQLNEMLSKAEGNEMMNMTIGELFKNGSFQKAKDVTQAQNPNNASLEFTDEHMSIITNSLQNPEILPQVQVENKVQPNQTFIQKFKKLF